MDVIEIKNVKTDKTKLQVGEKFEIQFEIWYQTDYPYDYPYDYPISVKKK